MAVYLVTPFIDHVKYSATHFTSSNVTKADVTYLDLFYPVFVDYCGLHLNIHASLEQHGIFVRDVYSAKFTLEPFILDAALEYTVSNLRATLEDLESCEDAQAFLCNVESKCSRCIQIFKTHSFMLLAS